MAYEGNVALARVISKALKEAGYKTFRNMNSWTLHVNSLEGGTVALECKKNDDQAEDVYLWIPPQEERSESSALKAEVRRILHDTGLRVGT
jgi:hypothetical protein